MYTHVRLQNLNYPTCALLEGERLEHDVITVRFLNVYEGVFPSICLEDVWVNLLTNFAAKSAPVDSPTRECAVLALFSLEPVLEADIVDIAHATTTFADREKRILDHVVTVPTEATERIVIICVVIKNLCRWIFRGCLGLFSRLGFGLGRVSRHNNSIFLLFIFFVTFFASLVLT